MELFEDFKANWKNRPEIEAPKNGAQVIIKKMNFIAKKQQITLAVMIATALLLVAFFFYVKAYLNPTLSFGLTVMVAVLVIRGLIAFFSSKRLKSLDPTVNSKDFANAIATYYKKRQWLHFVLTPVLIGVYVFGFVKLLPAFKASLSEGFYTYIVVSSIVTLIALAVLFIWQIRKELFILKQLKK